MNYEETYIKGSDGLRRIRILDNQWNLLDENDKFILPENVSYIYFCNKNGDREVGGKNWNYKTLLKQKIMKNLLDKNN